MSAHPQQFTFEWSAVVCALGALAGYLYCVFRGRGAARSNWSAWRTASFTVGVLLLIAGLSPPVAGFAHGDLRGHMAQHLVLGMFAPLFLVLAAPMSLLLRSLSPALGRMLVRVLHSWVATFMSHPLTALMLNVGGMYVLYLTPLYAKSLTNPLLHGWVHLHFIFAGYLFTWSIAGPDPALHRPSPRFRVAIVFLSIAAHAILAKAMYAYGWPRNPAYPLSEVQAAAKLMYYGGDMAEFLLLVALLHRHLPALMPSPKARGARP